MKNAKEYKAIREEIYRFIASYIMKHTYPPSNREIEETVGVSATTVHRHITGLIEDGVLETDAEPGAQRAIRIKGTQVVKRRTKNE